MTRRRRERKRAATPRDGLGPLAKSKPLERGLDADVDDDVGLAIERKAPELDYDESTGNVRNIDG